jgi:hypothetical protein
MNNTHVNNRMSCIPIWTKYHPRALLNKLRLLSRVCFFKGSLPAVASTATATWASHANSHARCASFASYISAIGHCFSDKKWVRSLGCGLRCQRRLGCGGSCPASVSEVLMPGIMNSDSLEDTFTRTMICLVIRYYLASSGNNNNLSRKKPN